MFFTVLAKSDAGEVADRVVKEATGKSRPVVQVHPPGGIDELVLPEYATEAAQGWRLGVLAGGAAGVLAGALAGGLGWVTGLGTGLGAALGLLSGVLVGALCASMSGHRRASLALRQAVDQMGSHECLVTVDLGGSSQVQEIWQVLESQDPRLLDSL